MLHLWGEGGFVRFSLQDLDNIFNSLILLENFNLQLTLNGTYNITSSCYSGSMPVVLRSLMLSTFWPNHNSTMSTHQSSPSMMGSKFGSFQPMHHATMYPSHYWLTKSKFPVLYLWQSSLSCMTMIFLIGAGIDDCNDKNTAEIFFRSE